MSSPSLDVCTPFGGLDLPELPRDLFHSLALALDGLASPDLGPLVGLVGEGRIPARQFIDWADRRLRTPPDGVQPGASPVVVHGAHATGGHATPHALASFVAHRVGRRAGAVLDPACGCGHLLVAVALTDTVRRTPPEWHGWDTSSECIHAARIGLWLATGRRCRVADFSGVQVADALLEAPAVQAEVLVANPPFASIRALNREWGRGYVDALRRALPGLRGNFDLYLAFLLLVPQWLGPRAHFACIVPASFWSAEYAREGRGRILSLLREIYRTEDRALFPGVSVTSHVLVGSRQRVQTPARHYRLVGTRGDGESCLVRKADSLERPPLFMGNPHGLSDSTRPLGEVALVKGGTPGYQAGAVASMLLEAEPALRGGAPGYQAGAVGSTLMDADPARPKTALPFLTTRCIGAYRLASGPLRFQGKRWQHPVLPLDGLTPGKRRLFSSPKVLVAGVCKSLRACWDPVGCALGVGVIAIVPTLVCWECILALLNNPILARWYCRRFAGKELTGGYYAVNCGSLREVPVPLALVGETQVSRELASLVRRRCEVSLTGLHAEIEQGIQRIVSGLIGASLD